MIHNLNNLKIAYDMNAWMGLTDFIYFWHEIEKGTTVTKACLSQWYPCHFVIDGIRYNCAEQYMMAEKARLFKDEETRKLILKETHPERIKHLGRKVKNFDSQRWDEIATEIVIKGNVAKFSQNPELRAFLASTGNKVLAEASPIDSIWGIGMEEAEAFNSFPHIWRGKNLLGFALMDVRDILFN